MASDHRCPQLSGPLPLIIDDVHLLEGSRSTWLLKDALHRAKKRHIVLATRRDPILALHAARLAGKVREIRAHTCSPSTKTRPACSSPRTTSPSAQSKHMRFGSHTEGWPAGLRLSTTPLSHGARSDDALSNLLHGDTAVGSYLMGQALGYTADDVRGFLLQTSVSEFLDVELAQELTGRSDCARYSSEYIRSRVFCIDSPVGDGPTVTTRCFVRCCLPSCCGRSPDEVQRLSALARRHGSPNKANIFAQLLWPYRVSRGRCLAKRCWPDRVWRSRQGTGLGSQCIRRLPLPVSRAISACCCHRS